MLDGISCGINWIFLVFFMVLLGFFYWYFFRCRCLRRGVWYFSDMYTFPRPPTLHTFTPHTSHLTPPIPFQTDQSRPPTISFQDLPHFPHFSHLKNNLPRVWKRHKDLPGVVKITSQNPTWTSRHVIRLSGWIWHVIRLDAYASRVYPGTLSSMHRDLVKYASGPCQVCIGTLSSMHMHPASRSGCDV